MLLRFGFRIVRFAGSVAEGGDGMRDSEEAGGRRRRDSKARLSDNYGLILCLSQKERKSIPSRGIEPRAAA